MCAATGYVGAVKSTHSFDNNESNSSMLTEPEQFKPDLDSIQQVYVSDDDFIELETSDSTLLYNISNLFVKNQCLFVHSGNSIRVFDLTGEYLYDDIGDDRPVETPDYYQQYEGSSYFMSQTSTDEPCFCQFNISTHQTKMFHFNLKNRNFTQRSFFKIIDGLVYIEFRNIENNSQNPMFFKLKLSEL